jgi:hypothetical protein
VIFVASPAIRLTSARLQGFDEDPAGLRGERHRAHEPADLRRDDDRRPLEIGMT